MRHFAYGYAVSVTFSADMVTVSKFLVTSRQYPGVLFPKSPKVLNTAIGYGGLNTVTKNLRHYDFSCLFGPQKGQTRGDIAGVLVTRTSEGIRLAEGFAQPRSGFAHPFLLAGGALAKRLKIKELRG